MGWIADFTAWAAPEWALKREAARQRLQYLRAYDAAGSPRKWASWRRPGTSGLAEVARGQARVRNSIRDLVRNNGYAVRAHRTLCRASVGTGIIGAPVGPGGRRAGQRDRDAWARWEDHCDLDRHHDLYGLQLLVARTLFESGGALVRYYRQPFDAGEKIAPVRMRVLEEDFIDLEKSGELRDGGWIDRGIEYDAMGVKQALWLHPHHPGDISRWQRQRWQSERVPLGEVEHVYDMLRPGQDRGISIFAPAAMPLRDLLDYLEAEAMRKRVESCLSVFVTSDDGDNIALGVPAGRDGDTGAAATRLAPGMIHRLNPGEQVTTLTPAGFADITPFAEQLLFLAAAAGGVMFEHMTGNMKYVNYSSYRVGAFDFAGMIEQLQWLMFQPRMCAPMGRRFSDAARAAGIIGRDATIRWTPPPAVTSPDPVKDAEATERELRMGMTSHSEQSERRGYTWPERVDQVVEDLKLAEERGLQFDGDPRKARHGSGRPPGGGDAASEPEQDNSNEVNDAD